MRDGEGTQRPVVYLDVDDVLVRWEGHHREAAPHAGTFLRFLLRHFEVRWLSSWCPDGTMREDRLGRLADILDMQADELRAIRNPRGFAGQPFGVPPKHQGIDFDEPRHWVWIEDDAVRAHSWDVLKRHDRLDRYIECDTSARPDDLLRVRAVLEERLRLMDGEVR